MAFDLEHSNNCQLHCIAADRARFRHESLQVGIVHISQDCGHLDLVADLLLSGHLDLVAGLLLRGARCSSSPARRSSSMSVRCFYRRPNDASVTIVYSVIWSVFHFTLRPALKGRACMVHFLFVYAGSVGHAVGTVSCHLNLSSALCR